MYATQYLVNFFSTMHFSLTVSNLKPESQANIMCYIYCENVQMSQTLWYSKKSQRTQIQGIVSLDSRICYHVPGIVGVSENERSERRYDGVEGLRRQVVEFCRVYLHARLLYADKSIHCKKRFWLFPRSQSVYH
jgi:hypothetical protein